MITTYDITPSAIPSEMLYISGIARSARYAGTDSVRSVKSTLMIDEIIRKPTKISAGAVANEGIAVNIGAKIIASRNVIPVTAAESPVRPPASTPADDSTYVVVVDVPRTAPTDVAIASARSAGLILGSFSFSSSIPAFVDTPISVPSVSKISTKRNAKSTTIKSRILMLEKSALKHCPNVSS